MNSRHFLIIALVPLVFTETSADDSSGMRDYCEYVTLQSSHHYGFGTDFIMWYPADGNYSGDCNGDTIPADYDGHLEFAYGGAILTVADEDPAYRGCALEFPHHWGSIFVYDTFFETNVTFAVGADYGCDGLLERATDCSNPCEPPFPPGADGAYYVLVSGTWGHVTTYGYDEGLFVPVGPGTPKVDVDRPRRPLPPIPCPPQVCTLLFDLYECIDRDCDCIPDPKYCPSQICDCLPYPN